jgi:DNA repair protein RadC
MTTLYAKVGTSYRPATRSDVALWLQAEVADRAPGQVIASPADSQALMVAALEHSPAEVFAALYLNNRHRVLCFEIAFRGTIDNTTVYPREIVRRAIDVNAAAVIFGHNHPSGDPTPSDADRLITRRLRDALEMVDVRVLDHLVVGRSGSCSSLAALGLI